MKRFLKWLGIVVGILVIGGSILAVGAYFFLSSMFEPPENIKDVAEYEAVLERWKLGAKAPLVDHFPVELPKFATDARLDEFPGFMQGGAHFQLRFSAPQDVVQRIYDEASVLAKMEQDGGGITTSVNSAEGGLLATNFRTSDDPKQRDFPDDYRIFVFDGTTGSVVGGDGITVVTSNPRSYGIVVSIERGEVIYFAEGN